MRLLCGTCRAVYDASEGGELRCESCRSLGREPTVSSPRNSSPRESWFVRGSNGQAGPYGAAELSRRLLSGELAWTDDVWREGLPSYRHARRDDLLVLAVASVRGLAAQTTRLDSVQTWLSSAETRLPTPADAPRTLAPGTATLLPGRPRPPRPPTRRVSAVTSPPRRPLTIPPPPPPTLSRPSVPPGSQSRGSLPGRAPHRSGGALGIALLAFCAGAVVALGPSQLFEVARALPQGLRVQVSGTAPAALPAPAVPSPALPLLVGEPLSRAPAVVAAEPLTPPASAVQARNAPPAGVGQELALELAAIAKLPRSPSELAPPLAPRELVQTELARIGHTLQRCVPLPHRTLALVIKVAGTSGRIQKLEVRAPALRPGALACVKEAFDDFHVAAFDSPSLQLKHRYQW